jgi:hypothetical protein
MAESRRTPGWKTEHVIVAVIGGVAAVLVAVIGLIGVSIGGGDSGDETHTEDQESRLEPRILIDETTFVVRRDGQVEIRVAGTVIDFRGDDRLYAIAKPASSSTPAQWWVSREVEPNLNEEWAAVILAFAEPGQELRVSAVRVRGINSAAPVTEAEIRASLSKLGPESPFVWGESPPRVAVPVPPADRNHGMSYPSVAPLAPAPFGVIDTRLGEVLD